MFIRFNEEGMLHVSVQTKDEDAKVEQWLLREEDFQHKIVWDKDQRPVSAVSAIKAICEKADIASVELLARYKEDQISIETILSK